MSRLHEVQAVNIYKPARVTQELPASTIFSTKFIEVTYKKGLQNFFLTQDICPLYGTSGE